MNSPDNNIKKLINSIHSWKQPSKKLVIGIDGYSGSGKTTLLNQLALQDNNILSLNRDAFAIPRNVFQDKFQEANDEAQKIALLVEKTIDATELARFILNYKSTDDVKNYTLRGEISGHRDELKSFDFSKPILVIEGIFLFHHKELFGLLDKRVYIDVNQEEADERRRRREKAKWGADYFPDTHPDSFSRLIKIGFTNYFNNERPDRRADLVLHYS